MASDFRRKLEKLGFSCVNDKLFKIDSKTLAYLVKYPEIGESLGLDFDCKIKE